MCAGIVVNGRKTIAGWNLDIRDTTSRKGTHEEHPWMGLDRFRKAEAMLKNAADDFDVDDGFAVLRAVSRELGSTVVSMVYDTGERTVSRCENRNRSMIRRAKLKQP